MKKTILTLGLITCSLLTAGEEIPEIGLRDLDRSLVENWQDKVIPCIVRIKAGDELPIEFQLSGTVLAFTQIPEGGKIKALQDFYIKILDKETLLVSRDKEIWKPFGDFFGGQLSTTVIPTPYQDQTGIITLEIHTK